MKIWNTFKTTVLLAGLTGLSTHPNTAERIKRLRAMPTTEMTFSTSY